MPGYAEWQRLGGCQVHSSGKRNAGTLGVPSQHGSGIASWLPCSPVVAWIPVLALPVADDNKRGGQLPLNTVGRHCSCVSNIDSECPHEASHSIGCTHHLLSLPLLPGVSLPLFPGVTPNQPLPLFPPGHGAKGVQVRRPGGAQPPGKDAESPPVSGNPHDLPAL